MGGISTVDLGLWHEIESPAISGKMSKGIEHQELSVDLPRTTGEETVGRASQVREIQLIQGPKRVTCPISNAQKFDTTLKGIKEKVLWACFCFLLVCLRPQLYLEIDFQLSTG